MVRFMQMKTLQRFASVNANVHNHFSLERHLVDGQTNLTRDVCTCSRVFRRQRLLASRGGLSLTWRDNPYFRESVRCP